MLGHQAGYHESQRFHGAVLIAGLLIAALSTVLAIASIRQASPWVALGPLVVALVALLITLSHLDIDVTDDGVRIAFRYLGPARRIAFRDILSVETKRYRPLLDYGGWGVRLGPAGWAFSTGGDVGVRLRLRRGLPVLIGSRTPDALAAAIHARLGGPQAWIERVTE